MTPRQGVLAVDDAPESDDVVEEPELVLESEPLEADAELVEPVDPEELEVPRASFL